MNQDHEQLIKTIVVELITKIGFSATVEIQPQESSPEAFLCALRVEEGQNFLIGQYGMNLAALQHLVRILVRKKLGEKLDIIVDVNDYFLGKKQFLEKEASQALEEVLGTSASVTMRSMLPYERKVVHSFFSGNENVTTESIGQGEERKVVIRPRLVTVV